MPGNPRSRSLGGFAVGGVIAVLIAVFVAALVMLRQQTSSTSVPESPAAPATAFHLLHVFDGYTGATPSGGVAYDPRTQTLFAAAQAGGPLAAGTVVSMRTDGTRFEVLHKFAFTDGAGPAQVPVLSSDGSTLFGATSSGGANGMGTLWSMNVNGGDFRVLANFTASRGSAPRAPPVLGPNGRTLYGTTSASGRYGSGTVYRVHVDGGGYRVLAALGRSPRKPSSSYGQLAFDRSHTHLFGLSFAGGRAGGGTLFRVATDGHGLSLLHSFGGDASMNGSHPQMGHVVLGANGTTLYGLTSSGGGSRSYGAIFRIGTDGDGYQVLHRFRGTDGANPFGSLTLAPDGRTLYGETLLGGGGDTTNPQGTIFRIRPDGGGFRVLHVFDLAASGGRPFGELALSRSGERLFGAASLGGSANAGSIFSFDLTAGPGAGTG
jgi:uncharacterized repeat protein (TIGR03803 family)